MKPSNNHPEFYLKLFKKYFKLLFILMIYISLMHSLRGQGLVDEFEKAQSAHQTTYNDFVEKADREFVTTLKENWKIYELREPKTINKEPKPIDTPVTTVDEIGTRIHQFIPTESVPVPLNRGIETPKHHKVTNYHSDVMRTSFDFFGSLLTIKYDPAFEKETISSITPESIAKAWESLSASNYTLALEDLVYYRNQYSINDFSYYLLLQRFSTVVTKDTNTANLLTWFLLLKTKLKARIAYSSNRVYLLLSSQQAMYDKNYLETNGVTYYMMEDTTAPVFSYHGEYSAVQKEIDCSFSIPLNMPIKKGNRALDIDHKGKSYHFDFSYNENTIRLYNEFPSLELSTYFNSLPSSEFEKSIIMQLAPVLKEMSEVEQVEFLLHFVQVSFDYQVDEEQFGKEKAFFPEEIIHYPYADCEDRSAFFAYLISTLIGLDVIGIDYPNHVATAVSLREDMPGSYVESENSRFIVCDPTYINAPIGVLHKDYRSNTPTIVLKTNPYLSDYRKDLLQDQLGQPKVTALKYSVSNNGVAMVGSIPSEKGMDYTLNFFDEKNDLEWQAKIEAKQKIRIKGLEIDSDLNVYVLYHEIGFSDWTLIKVKNNFIVWEKPIVLSHDFNSDTNLWVSLYDLSGQEISSKAVRELINYQNKQLSVFEKRILVTKSVRNE